jgi:hypothetical protein
MVFKLGRQSQLCLLTCTIDLRDDATVEIGGSEVVTRELLQSV